VAVNVSHLGEEERRQLDAQLRDMTDNMPVLHGKTIKNQTLSFPVNTTGSDEKV
jgi:hypothetical protein